LLYIRDDASRDPGIVIRQFTMKQAGNNVKYYE